MKLKSVVKKALIFFDKWLERGNLIEVVVKQIWTGCIIGSVITGQWLFAGLLIFCAIVVSLADYDRKEKKQMKRRIEDLEKKVEDE